MGHSRRSDEGHCIECGKRGCRKHKFDHSEIRNARRKAKELAQMISLKVEDAARDEERIQTIKY